MLDTSIQASTIQSYNVEGTQSTSTSEKSMQVHLNATIATPTSGNTTSENNPVTLKSALLQIQALRKKYNEANEKLQIGDTVVRKANKTKRKLLQQIRQLKSKNRLRTEKPAILRSSDLLHKVFNDDQIKWLQEESTTRRVYKWSEKTIKKALRLKFMCSEHAYTELINQNIPLPSIRTLRRSIETINFQEGICGDIFDLLKDKVSLFTDEREKDCMLALDEMSLTPGVQNDISQNCLIGHTTIPNSRGKPIK